MDISESCWAYLAPLAETIRPLLVLSGQILELASDPADYFPSATHIRVLPVKW